MATICEEDKFQKLCYFFVYIFFYMETYGGIDKYFWNQVW